MQLEFNVPPPKKDETALFVEIILPLAVDGTFTYRVPKALEEEIEIGKRVTVQFGKRHIYTALVTSMHTKVPTEFGVKFLLEVLDEAPLISQKQFVFWDWVSKYYMCTLGEVMEAALPSYLKLKSETHVVLNPNYKSINQELKGNEKLAIQALESENELSLSELQEILHVANVMPLIRSLHGKGLILTVEDIKQSYKPKTEKRVMLGEAFYDEETIAATFQILEAKTSTQKQSDLLTNFFYLKKNDTSVSKRKLLEQSESSPSSLKSLIKKGILDEFEVILDRWEIKEHAKKEFALNEYQIKSLKEIEEGIALKKPVLFHGITGSGKTHLYVELLEKHLYNADEQGLYLVPEIALTTQLISRMSTFFGKSIAVYHSRLNNSERYELWMGIKTGKYQLVIGARSAVFLPFNNLKFIIVDEEHEASFKQQDPSPRYNGRDAAIVLANQLSIPILLGSATPSVEAFFNAQNNKFHYVYLGKRFGDVLIPRIELIDLREERKTKSVENNLSRLLKQKIEKHLNNKDQVILFQNRRGYAPVLECETCGWVPYCRNCDIILTYHKYNQTLSCHYCGYSTGVPQKCGSCGQHSVKMKGTGTERIEDDLEIIFPKKVIQRMDLDTTRKKHSLEDIISAVENGTIDILVGTQMVTKGLDFDKVKMVGVISGDSGLHHPDFRATERTFQMLVQVAGRAGRKGTQGEVCIQTYQPDHYIYQLLLTHNQKEFYATELQQRRIYKYPPFYRLIKITMRHVKIEKVNDAADLLFSFLSRKIDRKMLFGPEFGASPRLKNRFHKVIMIKIDINPKALHFAKSVLKDSLDLVKTKPGGKSVDYILDIDPY